VYSGGGTARHPLERVGHRGRTLDASRPCALGVFLAGLLEGDAAGSASVACRAGFSSAPAVRLRRNGVFLAVVGVLICGESATGVLERGADFTRSSCGVPALGSMTAQR
jgi:hypothetical protein